MAEFFLSGGCIANLDNELIDLADDSASVTIRRASHVEPDKQGRWIANLAPVTGRWWNFLPCVVCSALGLSVPVVLGPFAKRSQALAAESAWLNNHPELWI